MTCNVWIKRAARSTFGPGSRLVVVWFDPVTFLCYLHTRMISLLLSSSSPVISDAPLVHFYPSLCETWPRSAVSHGSCHWCKIDTIMVSTKTHCCQRKVIQMFSTRQVARNQLRPILSLQLLNVRSKKQNCHDHACYCTTGAQSPFMISRKRNLICHSPVNVPAAVTIAL